MKKSSPPPSCFTRRVLLKIAASAVIAGALCLAIAPANAQNKTSSPATSRESYNFSEKSAATGSRSSYADYTYEDAYEIRDSFPERTRYEYFIGPSWLYFSPDSAILDILRGSSDMYGVSEGFAATVAGHHFLSIESGFYYSSKNHTVDISGYVPGYGRETLSLKQFAVPVYLTYNYVFNLNNSKSLKLRFGPSVGLTFIRTKFDLSDVSISQSSFSFGAGAVLALRWETPANREDGGRWFFEISDRFMVSTSAAFFDELGYEFKTGTITMNQLTVSAGVTF